MDTSKNLIAYRNRISIVLFNMIVDFTSLCITNSEVKIQDLVRQIVACLPFTLECKKFAFNCIHIFIAKTLQEHFDPVLVAELDIINR